MLETLLIGILAILLGLVVAFAGYPLFRLVLPIAGFIYGFQIANAVLSGWLASLIVGLALAALLAVFAYTLWSVAVGFAGAMIGLAVGGGIGTSLHLWGWLTLIIALALGALFLVLAMRLKDPFVMIATAIAGGGMAAFGASTLLPIIFGPPGQPYFLYWVVWIGVAVIGFIAQWAMFKDARQYGDMMAWPPSSSVSTGA